MKRHTYLILYLLLFTMVSCGQGLIKTPTNAMNKFEEFKAKEKFVQDTISYYPGIAEPTMRPVLTERINLAASDFEKLAQTNEATDKDYQGKIEIGLQRFNDVYIKLDTEDRERVCYYFEELMDIVGLESSDGLLNDFMYGFDPTEK